MQVLWEGLPREVEVSGRLFPVETDFRAYCRLTEELLDPKTPARARLEACLGLYREGVPRDPGAALQALLWFYRRGREEGKGKKTGKSPRPVLSYAADQWYVAAAFRQVYGLDLLTIPHLHWWEFCGLLEALPGDCPLKMRMGYRGMRLSDIGDRKERARIRRIQQEIALPYARLEDEKIGEALWMGGNASVGRQPDI